MSEDRDIQILIARLAEGTLSPEEAENLLAVCKEKAGVLDDVRGQLAMERLLKLDGGRKGIPDGFTKEVLAKISGYANSDARFTPKVLKKLPREPVYAFRRIAALAAVFVVFLSAWLLWKANIETPIVASVTGSEAMADFGGKKDFLVEETLTVDSGFLRLQFRKGAELILEGPGEVVFTGDNGAILKRGAASVRVPESATGFTLVGPDAKVIDVGTEFAMKVFPNMPTEVHVLDGLILTSTLGDPSQNQMREDEAIEVIEGAPRSIPAMPSHFLSDLPERKPGPLAFLHWTFDEKTGGLASNSGPGIAGFEGRAVIRSAKPGEWKDIHADGVFGSGIFLDGESTFVETDFPGIGGSGARTVAMWVKIPEDWQPLNGYAMASWGSWEKLGAAWQISVNPGDFGGEVGRLRVGTKQDYVVGSTDLRDGRWHHIAAVMFGGKGAAAATHVLLYVDGNLERTETKSTQTIDTDIESERSAKLQLGRNLVVAVGYSADKRFFRGWLDEVVVADGALSLKQVRSLMEDNIIE